MATSCRISGSEYTYTISNIQNNITCTPSNRNSRYGAVYSKPTITRNKSGEALTRYFFYQQEAVASDFGRYIFKIAAYKAVFTKTGTTATVTEVQTESYAQPLGKAVWLRANYNDTIDTICVYASTSSSVSSYWAFEEVWVNYTFSGWTPAAPSFTDSEQIISQSSPSSANFGYIKGFASMTQWKAKATATTWSYSLNGVTGTIAPNTTVYLTGNGTTVSSGPGKGTRAATVSTAKTITSTSWSATAYSSNTLGGKSSTTTKTVTVQDYSKPQLSNVKVERATPGADITFDWTVAAINKSNKAQAPCTTNAITAAWSMTDNLTNTIVASDTAYIVKDGYPMTAISDSAPINSTYVYDPEKSYTLAITLTDRINQNSNTITYVMPTEFYTIDFKAGGKGIAFGAVAEHANEVTFHVEGNNSDKTMMPVIRNTSTATSDNDTYFTTIREDTGIQVGFGIGAGGINHGIWSNINNHWTICENSNKSVTIGNPNTATLTVNGESYSKPSSISLGAYVATGVLSSSSGALYFSIPTGRVFPRGTSLTRLTGSMVVRAGNHNAGGMYIVKSASNGSSPANFDTNDNPLISFYNGANVQKNPLPSTFTKSIQGGTNIYIQWATGTDYYFSGNSTNNGYVNNQPVTVWLSNLVAYFSY